MNHNDYWTVWYREKSSDELVRGDSYDTQDVAEEMASELYWHHKYAEVLVRDKFGKEVRRFARMTGNGDSKRRA